MRTITVDAALEAVFRRDRVVVITALLAVIALSWAYLLTGAGMPMGAPAVWTPGYAVLMFCMWCVMMAALMLHSAAPMILLFATVTRKQRDTGYPYLATSIFVLGYPAAWAGFSSIAGILSQAF